MTRWSPDTCECIVEYTDDGNFTLTNVAHKCIAHNNLTDIEIYNTIKQENTVLKNPALQTILDNSPTTALYDIVNGNRKLKETIGFIFSFSGIAPNRVLTVSFTGITLTTNQKNTLQTFLNNKFGVGKVIIQ